MHLNRYVKIALVLTFFSAIALANLPKTQASDNLPSENATEIQIPKGESKTLWELATDPYTRYLGGVFHMMWIMIIAGLIWFKSQTLGLPLLWITISSSTLAGLALPGVSRVFFVLVAAFAITAAGMRIIIKRRRR